MRLFPQLVCSPIPSGGDVPLVYDRQNYLRIIFSVPGNDNFRIWCLCSVTNQTVLVSTRRHPRSMAKVAQAPRLCTCKVVGCGSKETWCHSRGERIPGQWILKALFSRHRRADKSFREFPIFDPLACAYGDSMTMPTLLSQELGSVVDHEDNSVLESNTAESDLAETVDGFSQEDYDYDPLSIHRTKEETYDVEEAIHDLRHISTALGQILTSLSHTSKLEFAVVPIKDVSYQLFTSIPSGPNMGHQRLTLKSPQNTHFLMQESELYKLLIALRTFCFPETHLLDCCRRDILAQVKEGLFQVDRMRAAAWDLAANRRTSELAPDAGGGKRAGNAVVVNSGDAIHHSWTILQS